MDIFVVLQNSNNLLFDKTAKFQTMSWFLSVNLHNSSMVISNNTKYFDKLNCLMLSQGTIKCRIVIIMKILLVEYFLFDYNFKMISLLKAYSHSFIRYKIWSLYIENRETFSDSFNNHNNNRNLMHIWMWKLTSKLYHY